MRTPLITQGEYGFDLNVATGTNLTGLTLTVTLQAPSGTKTTVTNANITRVDEAAGDIKFAPVTGTFDEVGQHIMQVDATDGGTKVIKSYIKRLSVGASLT